MQHRLRDLEIWKNTHFWESSFFEAVETERKTLSSDIQTGVLDWSQISNDQRIVVMKDEENIVSHY